MMPMEAGNSAFNASHTITMMAATKTAIGLFGKTMMEIFGLLVDKLAFLMPLCCVGLFPKPKLPSGSNE